MGPKLEKGEEQRSHPEQEVGELEVWLQLASESPSQGHRLKYKQGATSERALE